MLALVAVFPVIADLIDNGVVRFLLQVARWVLIAVLVTVALAVLYRVAPDRDAPKIRWVSVGAAVATVLWLLASLGFSIYVANFGNYAKTYGVFAGIVVMLFWLWITSYAILLGAEINAESEQQTVRDTTKGPRARWASGTPSRPTRCRPGGGQGGRQKRNEPRRTGEHQHRSPPGAHPPTRRPAGRPTPRSATWSRRCRPDLSRLVRDEMQLAQLELSAKAKTAGAGIGRSAGRVVVGVADCRRRGADR